MSQRIVCPHCWTVLPPAVPDACPHCATELAWLRQAPEPFQEALQCAPKNGGRDWRFQLHVKVQWAGGETSLKRELPADFPIHVPETEPLQLKMERFDGPLSVSSGGRQEQHELPKRFSMGPAKLYCWVAAEVSDDRPHEGGDITRVFPTTVPLDIALAVGFGSEIRDKAPNWVNLLDPKVDLEHCLVFGPTLPSGNVRRGERSFWIVDCRSQGGTFVNRQAVIAKRLAAGDLVQIGPYAWLFNQEDGHFVPAPGIDGVSLEMQNVGLKGRLGPFDLAIAAGEFVAIIGPSGAGKSTLIQTILGAPGSYSQGVVRADGWNIEDNHAAYQGLLAYVSQKPVVHAQLPVRDAVEYSALLRRGEAKSHDVDATLRSVELPEGVWHRPLRQTSGGEGTRVRTATELITKPHLIVLGEPTSGVDRDREIAVFRMLRSLSWQGCTVVVVTHALERLGEFDRVLLVRDRRLLWEGTPERLRERVPSKDFRDLDLATIEVEERPAPQKESPKDVVTSDAAPPDGAPVPCSQQVRTLLRREWHLAWRDWAKSLVLPLVVVPLIFAFALHLAVPPTKLPLLGFLSILSVIWMGSSLSLMAIVNEREVFEHERLLYLRIPRYLGVKFVYLAVLALLQTIIFVLLLYGFRWLQFVGEFSREGLARHPEAMLHGIWRWGLPTLLLTSLAAVGMGLLISASVRTSKPAAGFVLPLVMIAQIVFSVQVAGKGDESLHVAYGEFQPRTCQAPLRCPLRAQYWRPGLKPLDNGEEQDERGRSPERYVHPEEGWLCSRCFQHMADRFYLAEEARQKREEKTQAEKVEQHNEGAEDISVEADIGATTEADGEEWTEGRNEGAEDTSVEADLWAAWEPPSDAQVHTEARRRPPRWAASLSYATFSRHADIALRGYAYSKPAHENFRTNRSTAAQFSHRRWRRDALLTLGAMAVALPLAAGLVLWSQLTWLGSRCLIHLRYLAGKASSTLQAMVSRYTPPTK